VEKAHPEAHNMLLQIMEEGQLSDAKAQGNFVLSL
jgi:ATP-dependent Clp protease ATP-binding subunit ClpC